VRLTARAHLDISFAVYGSFLCAARYWRDFFSANFKRRENSELLPSFGPLRAAFMQAWNSFRVFQYASEIVI
jgi:hypothetical protein